MEANMGKTTAIKIRLSEKERKKIKENAKKYGLNMSEYLREVGTNQGELVWRQDTLISEETNIVK